MGRNQRDTQQMKQLKKRHIQWLRNIRNEATTDRLDLSGQQTMRLYERTTRLQAENLGTNKHTNAYVGFD